MNILLLAPHPFYQERGTPIAVDLLLRALEKQGHRVDVLTYHEGDDRTYGEAIRIHRIPPPPGCRNIRPGFSLKKVIADVYLHRVAARMLKANTYDAVHAVEETAFIARSLTRRRAIPYIFDMDSSMPVQIVDALPFLRPLLPLMRYFERKAIKDAFAITAVCDALADIARDQGATRIFLLRDVPLLDSHNTSSSRTALRDELNLSGVCLLYVGNLEAYQGIDLLLKAFAQCAKEPAADLVIVGGIAKHIARYQALAKELGIEDRVHFTGPRPVHDLPALLREADILASPRTKGQNTPMKIYSYMAAGKAILATDLPTHTQVLTPESAALAAPSPDAMSKAMHALIQDAELRHRLGTNAQERVRTQYSLEVFEQTVADLYATVEGTKG